MMHPLYLPIRLRVVGGGQRNPRAQQLPEYSPKLQGKAGVQVIWHHVWNPNTVHNMVEKQMCYSQCGELPLPHNHGNQLDAFGQLLHNSKYIIE